MSIRNYQHSDQSEILEILKLNTPAFFSPEEEKDLIYYLGHEIESYYVIEEDNKILGCGGFNLSDNPEVVKISWDIVHPQSQGKGLGGKLLKFRIEEIKKIDGVKIVSVRTSQLVYKFYERFGFETQEIKKDYWAEGFDLYRMECEINSFQFDPANNLKATI